MGLGDYMFFVPPLVWPWCISASHNARTGRLWYHRHTNH